MDAKLTSMNWHQLDIEKIFEATGSSPTGLSSSSATQKIEQLGVQ
jgi:hypothetical protein